MSDLPGFKLSQFYFPISLNNLLIKNCQEFPLDKTNLLQLKNLLELDISNTYCRTSNLNIFPKKIKSLAARQNSIKFLNLISTALENLDIADNTGCELGNIPETIKSLNISGKGPTEIAFSLFPRLESLNAENN